MGDPVELAGLQALHWFYDSDNNTSGSKATVIGIILLLSSFVGPISSGNKMTPKLKILTRHHFSSALQRMSAVIELVNEQHKKVISSGDSDYYNSGIDVRYV